MWESYTPIHFMWLLILTFCVKGQHRSPQYHKILWCFANRIPRTVWELGWSWNMKTCSIDIGKHYFNISVGMLVPMLLLNFRCSGSHGAVGRPCVLWSSPSLSNSFVLLAVSCGWSFFQISRILCCQLFSSNMCLLVWENVNLSALNLGK